MFDYFKHLQVHLNKLECRGKVHFKHNVPAGYNRCLVSNRFYCLSHRTSQYGKELNISVSRLRCSANQSTSRSQDDELCKNRRISERRSIEEQQ